MKDKFYLVLFVFFSNFLISDEIKIGIGSCLDQDFPQPIWQPIEEENLDYFIFLGDNVYGDSIFENLYKMKRAYSKQEKLLPDFLDQTDIFAIWDDHDYGKNDEPGLFIDEDVISMMPLRLYIPLRCLSPEKRIVLSLYFSKIFKSFVLSFGKLLHFSKP